MPVRGWFPLPAALELQLLYLLSALNGLQQHLVPAEPVSLLRRGFGDGGRRSELRRVLTAPFSSRLLQDFEGMSCLCPQR